MSPLLVFRIFLLLAVLASGVSAQTTGASLRGRIGDPSGRAVPSVELTLTQSATGFVRSAASDEAGMYAFTALTPGEYVLEAQADGFEKQRQEGVSLRVDERLNLDLELVVGSVQDEVTVAAPPLIPQRTAALGALIPNNYIVNLPLDGRNFLELALLAAGTAPAAAGSAGTARGRFAFHAAGARESANAFLYDGVYAVDPVLNSVTFTPPVDAVREFRVETSNSEAGQGRNSGAQVAVALKQGGNEFHGTVYEFVRNDALDARNFFDLPDRPQPKLRRNQFGFSLGGPIRRNTTFFFADYEGLRERRAETRTTNVPTAAERRGDFSGSQLPPPVDFLTGQPFPNAQLPFVHPIGAAVADLYPLPNRDAPGQNFASAPTGEDDADKFDVKLDQRLGRRGQLTARYSSADRRLFEPFAAAGFSAVPGYGNDVDERGRNAMLGETHTFGSRWVNEARFGFNRVDTTTFHENSGVSLNQTVGLPDFSERERDLGLTFIEVTGFSPLGDEFNNPQDSVVDSYQLSDTLSFARGAHLVEAGVEHRWLAGEAFRDVQSRGQISFTDFAYTGNALADLLLGLPTFTGGAVSDNLQRQRSWATNVFLQDDWRLLHELTLTLGVRYEYFQPPYDKFDAAAIFDPAAGTTVRLGTGGLPRGGYEADRNNFAPRIGLAWSPHGAGGTIFRAGYGLHYNTPPLAPGLGIYFNPPFFNFLLYYPSAQAPLSIENPWPQGAQAPLPPSAVTYDRRLRTSYAQQWNFTVEQELGGEVIAGVSYNGTRGVHLLGARDINQPAPSPVQPNLRPLPTFADINQIEGSFDSIYHSLEGRLQCRFRAGLTGLFSYAWSKSIDNASNFFASSADANFPQNSYDTGAERGLSSFNPAHRFVGSFAYDLPFGADKRWGRNAGGFVGGLISGWRLNGVLTLQTGQPLSAALPGALDQSNTGRSIFGFGAGDRPNVVGDPRLGDPDPALWFDPAAFALPAYGSFGNAGRNIIEGPPLRNVNLSALKDLKLSERTTLQFRAEFFNALNTANFRELNVFFGTPGFGRALSALDGREVQFGLKLLF